MLKMVTGLIILLGASEVIGGAAPVTVHNAQELRQAVLQARPGMRILVAPGEYPGGFYFSDLKGQPGKPVVIAAADPERPPVIKGSGEGMHLTDPAYVELHHLTFVGATGNGLNIDDGGSYDSPAHHIVLRGLKVADVGPGGNHDGIKLSGVDDFRVEGCTLERWGTGGGSGVDMVGCHRGVFEGNRFRHTDTEDSTGIQAKGGTSQIVIRRNCFENAGGRAINIGGSTGLPLFRPPLTNRSRLQNYEAKDILVEGNLFIGGGAPVAFVGVDGSRLRFNTIYRPRRWALRILQETTDPDFVPSRNGHFTDNIIAFRSDEWAEAVNIGPKTAPQTFRFARNLWYCLDNPAKSRPALPTQETGGVYGKNPLFRNAERGDLRLKPNSPARKIGADALPK